MLKKVKTNSWLCIQITHNFFSTVYCPTDKNFTEIHPLLFNVLQTD